MKRVLVSLLLLSLCLPLISGCHGSRGLDEFVIPESFDETKQLEITFWAKNDTNKAQTRIYEKAIRDFEALYPNISVNLRLYTDYGKIYNDVITNMLLLYSKLLLLVLLLILFFLFFNFSIDSSTENLS